jgi:hypothetical protein
MKNLLKITALSLLTTPLFAQFEDFENYQFKYWDQKALQLSMPQLQGNARFVAMGGAFGALGGNLSALSTNPGSIGIYRSSEFSFTPTLTFGGTRVEPEQGRMREPDPISNFNMGNIGWVSAIDVSKSDNPNEWKMVQFGIGLNRIADFWNRSNYSRYADNPFLNVLTQQANELGNLDNDFFRGLAWDAGPSRNMGLIRFDPIDDEYWNMLEGTGKGLAQRQNTKTTGAINEFVLTFGGNYGDFFYLGATLGFPRVNLNQEKRLRETAEPGEHVLNGEILFKSWEITENSKISGSGINLKIGAIVRPTDFMRIGLAVHTPTRYSLKEDFSTVIINGDMPNRRFRSRIATDDYSIKTPMKIIGSLGFIVERKALISLEYEMVDYSKMRTNGDMYYFDESNDFIYDHYRMGGVLRLGAEYRLENISLRAGYNHTMEPYSDNSQHNFSGQTFSAGLGFQVGTATIDLAYVRALQSYRMSPYPGMPNDFYNRYNVINDMFVATIGWRF